MDTKTNREKPLIGLWMTAVSMIVIGFSLQIYNVFEYTSTFEVGCVAVATIVLLSVVPPKKPNCNKYRFLPPFLTVPAIMLGFWSIMIFNFGNFGLGPILFHMEFEINANGATEALLQASAFPLLCCAVALIGIWLLSATDHRFSRIDRLLVLPALILNPVSIATIQYVGDAEASSEQLLKARYVDVADLSSAGSDSKNLIHIFLESSEMTLSDEAAFGAVMAPLQPFAQRGTQLTNVDQAVLTDWTLAGSRLLRGTVNAFWRAFS